MKRNVIAGILVLATASMPVQVAGQDVTKNRRGVGFDTYGTNRSLDSGQNASAGSTRAATGATGSSDVPVYKAKSGGVRLRRITQQDAAEKTLRLSALNGMHMKGVPIYAGDASGSLRIVRLDRHVFGVVDGLRVPLRGSSQSDDELGRSLSGQVARRTGCSVGGPAVMQFQPGHLSKISVPLVC